ncbi:MAG: Fe-Mn family superoxide dismutase [Candidatus Nanoarchaeia archaeon]
MERTVKSLKYLELNGLSEKQLAEHHDVLYAGYVKKINEIRSAILKADKTNVNGTYAELRELKVEETFALNAVKLHEGYFDNLGGDGVASGAIKKMIETDFTSFDKWKEEFMACGLGARGWVVLAFDLEERRLYNFVCDVHNQGGVWGSIPLLILDVYEHAYFIDYATGRKKYIEAFMNNIDWTFVNHIMDHYKIEEWRGKQ